MKYLFELKNACKCDLELFNSNDRAIMEVDFNSYNSKHRTIKCFVPEYGGWVIEKIKNIYAPTAKHSL